MRHTAESFIESWLQSYVIAFRSQLKLLNELKQIQLFASNTDGI
jgi:hypothetical protein